MKELTIGTRGSELALWQAHFVKSEVTCPTTLKIIKTQGDRVQNLSLQKLEGKGFFTKELEQALLDGSIDVAVHSAKDLPTENVPGLCITTIPKRASRRDMVIAKHDAVDLDRPVGLKVGTRIGTGALRRQSQLLKLDPEISCPGIRGNVPTRIKAIRQGGVDAVVLAQAGLERLGLLDKLRSDYSVFPLAPKQMLGAPAQGALAIQVREDDAETKSVLEKLHHAETAQAIDAEREVLRILGGGCHAPLGVEATLKDGTWTVWGRWLAPDGTQSIEHSASDKDAMKAAEQVANYLKAADF